MKIEFATLKNLGASAQVLDFYSETDPLVIYSDNAGFHVRGAFVFDCDTSAELLGILEFIAAAWE